MNLTLSIQKTRELITHSDEEKELEKKLESITKSLRKQYFKNNLVTLSKKNIEISGIIDEFQGISTIVGPTPTYQ